MVREATTLRGSGRSSRRSVMATFAKTAGLDGHSSYSLQPVACGLPMAFHVFRGYQEIHL